MSGIIKFTLHAIGGSLGGAAIILTFLLIYLYAISGDIEIVVLHAILKLALASGAAFGLSTFFRDE